MISSSSSAADGLRASPPRSSAVLDVVCRLDLCFRTTVGWDKRGENAAAASAAENQIPINYDHDDPLPVGDPAYRSANGQQVPGKASQENC